jgi:hypothetical protein
LLFESRTRVGLSCEHHFIGSGFRHIAIAEKALHAIDSKKAGATPADLSVQQPTTFGLLRAGVRNPLPWPTLASARLIFPEGRPQITLRCLGARAP